MLLSYFRYFVCVILLLTITSLANSSTSSLNISPGIYKYQESVGEKIIPFYWKVEKKDTLITVSVFEENKSFINVCSADGATLQWQLKVSGKHDIVANRTGNLLNVSGTRNGKMYKKTVKIDERPWFQPLSFSIRNFLASDLTKMSFWIIRVDTIEPIAMKVEKKEDDKILFNNTLITAQKVEVRVEGFYSPFWHGTYWYRKSDKLFLKYKSIHGPPGTKETIVKLIKLPETLN